MLRTSTHCYFKKIREVALDEKNLKTFIKIVDIYFNI